MNGINRSFAVAAVFFLFAFVQMSSAQAQSPKRVALVVGNSKYADAPLRNPSSDADAMAGMLNSLGFQVTKLKDVSKQQIEEAVDLSLIHI